MVNIHNWSDIAEINKTLIIQEQIIQAKNWDFILLGMVSLIIILSIMVFFVWKGVKDKKKGELLSQKKEELVKVIDSLKAIEKEITIDGESRKQIRVKRIYLDDLPEDIKESLKDKKHILNQIFNEGYEEQQPYMFLQKNDGTIEVKRKVKEGLLKIDMNDEEKSGKYINVKSNKMYNLVLGDKRIKIYIAHEDEAECYPLLPEHHAKGFFEIIQSVILNRRGLEPKGKKISKKLIVIIAGLIIVGLIGYWVYTTYFMKTPTDPNIIVSAVNQTINNTINNVSQNNGIETIKVVNIG